MKNYKLSYDIVILNFPTGWNFVKLLLGTLLLRKCDLMIVFFTHSVNVKVIEILEIEWSYFGISSIQLDDFF